MSEIRSKLIRLAYENPEIRQDILPLLREGGSREMAVYFPSHALSELGKVYDKLNSYNSKVMRDRHPKLAEHKKLMSTVMDNFVSLLAQLKRAEEALYYGRMATLTEWKLNFPSHSVRDKVDSLYDVFSDYEKRVMRDRSPELANHKKLLSKALSTYVTFLARLKDAELALYRAS